MYKDEFLQILLKQQVLLFGDFTTKSGRKSPFFFNTGLINNGPALLETARIYAKAVQELFPDVENFFGPAYKGIPLACATAMMLADATGKSVSFTYNRKEQKDHGEGGGLVGYPYKAPTRVVIIEDVLTAGTSLRESMDLLKNFPIALKGALVGIDRQEKSNRDKNAREDIEQSYGFPVRAIINLDEIIERLWNRRVLDKIWIDDATKARIDAYRAAHA